MTVGGRKNRLRIVIQWGFGINGVELSNPLPSSLAVCRGEGFNRAVRGRKRQ
jgi:hypothetical protein